MASNGVEPVNGAPRFPESDAPQTGADYEEVADFAAFRGNMPVGSTAERDAWAYAKKGSLWSNTSTGSIDHHDGSGWKLWHKSRTPWTPVATNVSGSPTITAHYSVASGVVHCEIEVLLAGANFGSAPSFSLPVSSAAGTEMFCGVARLLDQSATTAYPGYVRVGPGASVAIPYPLLVSGSTVQAQTAVTATSPFTWANTDRCVMSFDYMAG